MAMSNYLEEKSLGAILRGETFPKINNVYVALFTTDPGEDGSTGTEVTGGSYARKVSAFTAPVQVDGKANSYNNAEIDFGIATATWGNITHVALFDAATGGNMLYHEALVSAKLIETNDSLRFAANNLAVSQS